MILRVLRARVLAGEEARLAEFVRDEAVAHALTIPGLVSFQPAVRQTRTGTELAIVSTWTGFDEMLAAGASMDAPLAMPGARGMLADGHAEHYELVLGEARALPLREARMRLTRIPIRANSEARYYQVVREWSDRLLDESGLVAFTLGRRVVGRQDEIVAVQVWQSDEALREAAGSDFDQPMGRTELSEFWAAAPAIEHFDALTAIEPRADAPAILLADDQRRYVHATPAAELLSGRSIARLLTLRVEDVTRASERDAVLAAWDRFVATGSMAGPYRLERPDGSEVEVRFAAKANSPWPGSHASLLVPAGHGHPIGERNGAGEPNAQDDQDELDVDRALVEAGLVARYVRT
ncbi:MAG: hypothetical protein FIA92_18330 [Chloroflexi bacterium]|nr:hypothetical protein [Chloroflexota bacterium]